MGNDKGGNGHQRVKMVSFDFGLFLCIENDLGLMA
jgi:hypothetical protein